MLEVDNKYKMTQILVLLLMYRAEEEATTEIPLKLSQDAQINSNHFTFSSLTQRLQHYN